MIARKAARPRIRTLLWQWWMVPAAVLAGVATLLARQNPALTERLYSAGLYRLLSGAFGRLTSLFPYSIMELLICAALGTTLVLFFRAGKSMIAALRGRGEPLDKANLLRLLACAIKVGCGVFVAFVLLCGLNYYRPAFTTFSGLTVREASTEELAALCDSLAREANALRLQVTEDENGVTALPQGAFATSHLARDAFAGLAADYEVLPDLGIVPKPVLNSWWMSMMQITGVFSPYTYEANVNTDAPDYSIPATMCHELAHTRGFMREDEANFIGYLACRKSDSPEFRYSGVMLALVHAINRLYTADRAAYRAIDELMSAGVRRDFAANNVYWQRHEGPVAAASTAVNNTYLRANNQSDGVQSYGRMVDLLLAEQRGRGAGERESGKNK